MHKLTEAAVNRWQQTIDLAAKALHSSVYVVSVDEQSLLITSEHQIELPCDSVSEFTHLVVKECKSLIKGFNTSTSPLNVIHSDFCYQDKHYKLNSLPVHFGNDKEGQVISFICSVCELTHDSQQVEATLLMAAQSLSFQCEFDENVHLNGINLQNFINAFEEHIWIKDLSGQYAVCNQSVDIAWNKSHSEIIGQYDHDLFDSDTADSFVQGDRQAEIEGKPVVVGECERIDENNKRHWLETTKAPLYDSQDKLVGIIGITRNIARHKETQTQLLLAESVFENTVEGVLVTDRDGNITEVNAAFSKITGYERSEALGQNPRILNSGKHDSLFFSKMWNTLLVKGKWHGEIWNRRKSGEIFPQSVTINAIYSQEDKINYFVAVFADISTQKRNEEKLANLSYYDTLTQLPNRLLFRSILQKRVEKALHQQTQLAVVFFDIDFFKHINDSLGHDVGDKLLIEVGERLSQLSGEHCIVARLSSDEFVLLLTDIHQHELILRKINKLKSMIEQPFKFDDRPLIRVTLSMGVSVFPNDTLNFEQLLQNTDTALHIAKQNGRNNVTFYDSTMTLNSVEHLKIQSALHEAIQENQFHLVYQPKLSLLDSKLVGLESLIRWQHPEHGVISPAEFIPIAEKTGLIHQIGLMVLTMACKQGKTWLEAGYQFGHLAVNVASLQFQRSSFIDDVEKVLADTGFPANRLELEITESCMMYEPEKVINDLKRLGNMGIQLSVDDFGTGYSSLSYLKKLPINVLKIDQSFVADIPDDSNNTAIAKAIVAMGHALKLTVIAEGVETKEQAAFLLENGCDQAQGYFFSKPQLPATLTPILPQM
ncbi:EAL domain-containing protein [Shewanella sp. MMG014]|uniref:EAL domain-containing protein n=1 Tax=Shewanella sp. MMG014 TaxID=2822691 RepID=UPI001B35EBB0|nr:EAL domain-containing protein [Shewanella sp. MMG014]MBQ4889261.1 EAL domain-containing protein [Shewanella sp. MMG014]